jgi:hypothetical protein
MLFFNVLSKTYSSDEIKKEEINSLGYTNEKDRTEEMREIC